MLGGIVETLRRAPANFQKGVREYQSLNIETPRHDRIIHGLSLVAYEAIRNSITKTDIKGSIPKTGPAVIVGNHIHTFDPVHAHKTVAEVAGRTVRFMAKRTLVDPRAKESEATQAQRTQQTLEGKPFEELNPLERALRLAEAAYIRKFNPIVVDIGGFNINAFREVIKELKEGRLVGIFVQGHRKPDLDLLRMMHGIALLVDELLPAAGLEDTPIIPMGISGSDGGIFAPVKIVFGEAFFSSDIHMPSGIEDKRRRRQVATNIIDEFIGGKLAELIADFRVKPAWELKELGLTIPDIEEIYKRGMSQNPKWPDKFRTREALGQMASAGALVKDFVASNPGATPKDIIEEMKFIDEVAVFG